MNRRQGNPIAQSSALSRLLYMSTTAFCRLLSLSNLEPKQLGASW